MWKLANVAPIFKNANKQLIKNHRPISFLPVCGKIPESLTKSIRFFIGLNPLKLEQYF